MASKPRNPEDYTFSLKQRGSLSVRFDAEMARGRQQAYIDAAIQACLTLQSAVRATVTADDWICRKSSETCRGGLVSAGL
jgi:hypothetical protein